MDNPIPKLQKAKIDLGVMLLQGFAKRQSLVHSPSDFSPEDAQRFAENLMLDTKGKNVQKLMREDEAGAKAFLALMDDEGIENAYNTVEISVQESANDLPYAPICTWILAVLGKRSGKIVPPDDKAFRR